MAHHQRTGIVACSGTTCGTALGPLTTCIAGRQQRHGLLEVLFHLVEHLVVCAVGGIEAVERGIGVIIGNQNGVLIVTCEVIVSQTAEEKHLSLDTLHLI